HPRCLLLLFHCTRGCGCRRAHPICAHRAPAPAHATAAPPPCARDGHCDVERVLPVPATRVSPHAAVQKRVVPLLWEVPGAGLLQPRGAGFRSSIVVLYGG